MKAAFVLFIERAATSKSEPQNLSLLHFFEVTIVLGALSFSLCRSTTHGS